MLKMLKMTTAIAIVLATTAAHAGLICGYAKVDVGNPGRPGTGVIETTVSVNDGVWTVLHKLPSGEVIDRSIQYAMRGTTRGDRWQWKGTLLSASHMHMVGEIMTLRATGQPTYNEWLYDDWRGGALIMHSWSLCRTDEAYAPSQPPPAAPAQPAPAPVVQPPPAPVPPPAVTRDTSALDTAGKVYVKCLYEGSTAMALSSTEPAEVVVKATIGACNSEALGVVAAAKEDKYSEDNANTYIDDVNKQVNDRMLANILTVRAKDTSYSVKSTTP